jgi:hypothetical protein
MAKPIPATPVLRGKDAVRFIKTMLKEEKNPSPARVRTIRRALKSRKYFEAFL